jgi:hypothetical protein
MTPDELPADMEGRVKADLDEATKAKRLIVVVYEDNLRTLLNNLELARGAADLARQAIKNRDDAYATLLKVYQEQRRALERLANKDNEFGSEVQTIARAALNQKGDER